MLIMSKVWYPYWSWETYRHGFYEGASKVFSQKEAESLRMEFFKKTGLFRKTALKLFKEWPVATEHFLTDEQINRVAWLGQACSCYHDGLSDKYSYAYNLLEKEVRKENNKIAKDLIDEWLSDRDNGGCAGIYKKVEKARLLPGHTGRVPPGAIKQGASTFLQGNLFGNSSE